MAEDTRPRRFAVLIDADNTSPRIAAGLFEEPAPGFARLRRQREEVDQRLAEARDGRYPRHQRSGSVSPTGAAAASCREPRSAYQTMKA